MENDKMKAEPETKQAETRLKEMLRKAKQKGKDKTSTKTRIAPPLFNQNWFCIGIGLAGIAGISYLIYRARRTESETQPELHLLHLHHVLQEKAQSEKSKAKSPLALSEGGGKNNKGGHQGPVKPLFELNSF